PALRRGEGEACRAHRSLSPHGERDAQAWRGRKARALAELGEGKARLGRSRGLCSGVGGGGGRGGEEVAQEVVTVLGEYGLGMELHAEDRQAAVAQGHDLALLAPRRG